MSIVKTLATTHRVLRQLKHDKRTLALVLLVPSLLLILLRYIFDGELQSFHRIALQMLGIFPLIMMFLVTSIATLRERTTGTLDRLMTEPISKLDFIFGYAIAFSFLGLLQVALASLVTIGWLDVPVEAGVWPVLVVALSSAFLGTTLGLLVSAFATSEFQAVQLVMPIMMPQVLLCGLFVPRDRMSEVLERISEWLPLTYSVDAMQQVAMYSYWTDDLTKDLLIVFLCGVAALLLGSVTIRRQPS